MTTDQPLNAGVDAEAGELCRPVVLLAVPRSGSTLVRRLLNQHPDLFVAAPSDLLTLLANPQTDWPEVEQTLAREYAETRRGQEHVLAFLQRLYHAFWTLSGEAEALGKEQPQRWGFVTYLIPPDLMPLDYRGLFPDGRFIHVVRDGRNVVASWLANWEMAAAGMPVAGRDPISVARLWVRWVAAAADYEPHTVRLEDLAEPATRRQAVDGLFRHCGLQVTPAVEAFAQRMPRVNAEKDSPDRWRDDLDADTLDALYAVDGFADTLAACGYDPGR